MKFVRQVLLIFKQKMNLLSIPLLIIMMKQSKDVMQKCMYQKTIFLNSVEFCQFNKSKNYSDILFMRLIYFYLIDCKRYAVVNMNIVHDNFRDLIEENDRDSLNGHVLSLKYAHWLEITGRFEHKIMLPGKYEVSWRMNSESNR